MAKKLKFLATDPAEDVTMPQTKPVEKPVMTQEQILMLIGGIQACAICVFETSVLNAMNSRTMEILADWKPAILDENVRAINGVAPKRRTLKVETQLDHVGPSTEGGVVVSA